jgi:bla regulator protein blaR1
MENLFYISNSYIHYLFVSSIQIIPVFILVGFISLIFGNKSTNFRYWLWSVIIFRLCIPFNIPLPFGSGFNKIISQETADLSGNFIHTGQTAANLFSSSSLQPSASPLISIHFPVSNYLLIFWISAIAVLSVFSVFRIFFLGKTLHRYPKIERQDILDLLKELRGQLHIRRSIELYYLDTKLSISPLLYGILHPKIYIPGIIVQNWPVEDIKPILLHELHHIKRFDPVVNWIVFVVNAIYFFHPLVWIVNKKIKNYQEDSCDDISIRTLGNKKKTYLNCIINVLMETSKENLLGVPAIAFSERKTSVSRRVIRISDKYYKPTHTLKKQYVAALLFVVLISVMISCDSMVGYQDRKPAPPSEVLKNDRMKNQGGDAEQGLQKSSDLIQRNKVKNEVKENISILKNGDVLISGKIVPEEKLVEAIKAVIEQNEKRAAIILIDKNVKQDVISKVIDAATMAGSIFIMTTKK